MRSRPERTMLRRLDARSRLRIAVVLAGGLLLAAAPAPASGSDPVLDGFERPDARLSDFAGSVVLLHFWATWCSPCLREMPSLEAFYEGPYRELAERGLVVLTVSNDVRIDDVRRFQEKRKLEVPIFLDPLGSLHDRMQMIGHPATVVIDRRGKIVLRLFGPQDWESPAFHERIERFVAR